MSKGWPTSSAMVLPLMVAAVTACSKPAPEAPPQAAVPSAPVKRAVKPPADAPHWDYESAGPAKWASLSPDFAACGAGKSQSPIDLHGAKGAGLSQLLTSFRPAEMHLVHKAADGRLAVIGVLFEEGAANNAIEPIWANLPSTKGEEHHLANVTVDADDLLPTSRASYRYSGSLTTPPCSEDVTWIVMSTPVTMSAEQLGRLRSTLVGNNRPVQPGNGRPLVLEGVEETAAR